jgi:uncharacterized protein (DUF58 family)
VSGVHRSPFHGFSIEFAEHREYAPGDDLRYLDWKVLARTDKYYLKQFEEETNLACHIIVDASGSMGYGSKETGPTKLQYARCMAACLAYFMVHQRDATGLTLFDNQVRTIIPPRGSQTHLKHIMSELDAVTPGGETDIAGPLHELAEGLKRRGLVVLISDLMDDPVAVLSALQHFRFLGHDVIVFHVTDNAELTFPFDSLTEFTDMETGNKALITPEGMRSVYMEQMRRFLAAYEKGSAAIRADYKLFDTTRPLDLALSEYLYRRSRMM